MKKMLALVAVLVFSSMAMAQIDPDPDGMSLYFDTEGMTFCMDYDGSVPLSITAYLLLTNASVSEPAVLGWEAHLEIESNAFSINPWVLYDGTNVGSGMDFIVGNGAFPLPIVDGVCALAEVGILFFGQIDPYAIYTVTGVEGSLSYPNGTGYAAEVGFPKPCQPIFGTWGACAWVNGGNNCFSIANEDMTWGSVKSLY
jgi:hypothetical protein